MSASKRGQRLRHASKKRAGERRKRLDVTKAAFARDRGCVAMDRVPEVKCGGPLDPDEIVSRARRPGGHLDLDNVQVLCRAHHDWKHEHPIEAVERGLSAHSWEAA